MLPFSIQSNLCISGFFLQQTAFSELQKWAGALSGVIAKDSYKSLKPFVNVHG